MTYRFKMESNKRIETPLDTINLPRRVFQMDRRGKSIIPLDAKWSMENEFCTIGLREILLYCCAYNTPSETSPMLSKVSLLNISPTSIQRELKKCGSTLEKHGQEIDKRVTE